MNDIKIINDPDKSFLEKKGVFNWSVWEKGASSFPWSYAENEECYILAGEADIELSDGSVHKIREGDYVTFTKGLSCYWTVKREIRKHYNFF